MTDFDSLYQSYAPQVRRFGIENHKIIWIAFSGDAIAGSVFIAIAVVLWIAYFVMRFGDFKFPVPFTGSRLSAGAWRIKRK